MTAASIFPTVGPSPKKGAGRHILVVLAGAVAILGLLLDAAAPARATLPANGGLIAFSDINAGEIYTMPAEGGELTNITNNGAWDETPSFSPDGSKIAFASDRGDKKHFSIYMARADGTRVKRLTRGKSHDFSPSWSPGGRRIAFFSNRHGRYGIYVMRLGERPRRVTSLDMDAFDPRWSPSGRKFLFSSDSFGKGWDVYTIRVDGTRLRRLTRNDAHDYDASWSPDGRLVAFATDRNSEGSGQCVWVPGGVVFPSDCHSDIYTIRPDGSEETQITDGLWWDDYPVWSPDGTKIIFISDESYPSYSSDLFIMNPDGSDRQPLTDNTDIYEYYFPAWQPLLEKKR